MLKNIAYTYFKEIKEVYDPTCGRGNLLSVFDDSVEKYGQELNKSELEVAKRQLTNFYGEIGDTLYEPKFQDKKFDVIVANPPFSVKWIDGDKQQIKEIQKRFLEDERFSEVGVLAPNSRADFAFLLHIVHMLSENGVAITINFPGILYRKASEYKIRKYLVDKNYIESIESIPSGFFEDTNIETVLVIFNKNKKDTNIKFKDSYGERVATLEEVIENDYNLSTSSYIERGDTREQINIDELNIEANESSLKNIKSAFEINRGINEYFNDSKPYIHFFENFEKIYIKEKVYYENLIKMKEEIMLEEMEKLNKLIDEVIKIMLEKNVLLNDIDYIAEQIKLKLEFIKENK